jgi:hypothetical protein
LNGGLAVNTRMILAGVALAGLALAPSQSKAGLFNATGLDPSFCKLPTVRQTVVYVDDTIMVEGQVDWAAKIGEKLKASLMPGERVTVVQLSSGSGSSKEIWGGCWPNYTAEQRNQISGEYHIFSQNPLDALTDQQKFFMQGFGGALTAIYVGGKHPSARIDAAHPPQKQILRALASDEGRFSNSDVTVRAIVYSDMMENSDLGSVYGPLPPKLPNYADKLGSHLRRGVFYAFGVASDVDGAKAVQETAKAFWTGGFKSFSASLAGFGSDLNVSNRIPVHGYSFDASLKFNDRTLDGKISALVDADGNLVDSWIGFSMLSIAGLNGTLRCQQDSCKLDGATTSGIVTVNIPSEAVTLSGPRNAMNGRLGVKGTEDMFDLTAAAAN